MSFGSGQYRYEVVEGWGKLPDGWQLGAVPAIACDAQDRVYIYSRSERPLIIFDREGNFLTTWGDGLLQDAHGIYIDAEDNVYCVEREPHCVRKFNRHGELVLTIGTPGQRGANDGDPFRLPTNIAIASTGELFISDGYENARIHKYTPAGDHILSWGEWGDGPGQFGLSHSVQIDKFDRVWACDRPHNRIQIFDLNGKYLSEINGLLLPDTLYFDPREDVVYVAELSQRVSIFTLEGELLAQWGGAEPSDQPGYFKGGPHGIWADSRGDLYVGEALVNGRYQKFVRQR